MGQGKEANKNYLNISFSGNNHNPSSRRNAEEMSWNLNKNYHLSVYLIIMKVISTLNVRTQCLYVYLVNYEKLFSCKPG